MFQAPLGKTDLQGAPQKYHCFSLAKTFTKIRKPWRFFLHKYWKFTELFWSNEHLISWTEHLNTSGITFHATDSFRVKPITPGHPIPKISTHLTIFWGGIWKTEFVKTIHRQERTSSEEKSDGFHKKCSIELCCHTAAQCMELTCINYWKSIAKYSKTLLVLEWFPPKEFYKRPVTGEKILKVSLFL